MSTSERLKELQKHLGLTVNGFAEKIGVHPVSLSGMRSGAREISFKQMARICEVFNVSIRWLKYGEGEMMKPNPLTAKEQTAQTDSTLWPNSVSELAEYQKLRDDFAKVIVAAILYSSKGVQVNGKQIESQSEYATWAYDMAELMCVEKAKRMNQI